jgi:UDP-glucose 4-epimerase
MQVMIVGAAGFIGRRLSASLRKLGLSVHDISSSDGTGIDAGSGAFVHEISVPKGVKVIVYLAQSPYYRRVPEFAPHVMAVHSYAPVQLATAAIRAGVRRFLFASTGNVYEPSFLPLAEHAPLHRDNWYSLSKIHGEEALRLLRNHLDVTVMRLFGVYGPGQTDRLVPRLLQSIAEGVPIEIQPNPTDPGDLGGLKISLCYVDDVVAICRSLLMQAGPPCLNVAGEFPVSIRQIAGSLGRLIGREPIFKTSALPRNGDLIADISLLRSTLSPSFTDLAEGLHRVTITRPEHDANHT